MTNDVLQSIATVFNARGDDRYGAEAVTQRQHALQSALLARNEGAPARQVAAALLHDIGHILETGPLPHDCNSNLDDHHELRANAWLQKHFGPEVADPVRLHVLAKRYLCTVDPDYEGRLSPTSRKSFHDQGGLMSPGERAAFEREPFHREALALRRWDDLAKDPAQTTPTLEAFLPELQASLVKPLPLPREEDPLEMEESG